MLSCHIKEEGEGKKTQNIDRKMNQNGITNELVWTTLICLVLLDYLSIEQQLWAEKKNHSLGIHFDNINSLSPYRYTQSKIMRLLSFYEWQIFHDWNLLFVHRLDALIAKSHTLMCFFSFHLADERIRKFVVGMAMKSQLVWFHAFTVLAIYNMIESHYYL